MSPQHHVRLDINFLFKGCPFVLHELMQHSVTIEINIANTKESSENIAYVPYVHVCLCRIVHVTVNCVVVSHPL